MGNLLFISCISANKIRESIEADVIKCVDSDKIKIDEFVLSNNVWRKGGVSNYAQCIFQIQKQSMFPFGWKWEWPSVGYKVKAYPEIIYGWKPWSAQSTTKALPIKISNMKEIVAFYEIDTTASGRYNLLWNDLKIKNL